MVIESGRCRAAAGRVEWWIITGGDDGTHRSRLGFERISHLRS
jgi:hypothetical protein